MEVGLSLLNHSIVVVYGKRIVVISYIGATQPTRLVTQEYY